MFSGFQAYNFTTNDSFSMHLQVATRNPQQSKPETKNYHYYLGKYEKEINHTTNITTEYYYVGGPMGNIAVYISENGGEPELFYTLTDHLGSIVAIADEDGDIIEEQRYDPWGVYRNPISGQPEETPQLTMLFRGYTGHEMLPEFGLINMNGRLYDPVIARVLSPDNYVQNPYNPQNYNRYSYCYNNPLIYTDPDGEFIVPILVGAAIFGTGNLISHALRGDVNSFGDGLKYFGQGALVGAALGAAWQFAPLIPGIGQGIQTGMNIYGALQLGGAAVSTVSGLGQGIFTDDWSALGNAGKIFLGNFYLDENRSFFGGAWQGFSRHSWEFFQTAIGHSFTQLSNTFGAIDRVDFLGGATFATYENRPYRMGVSLGNFINVWIRDEVGDDFTDRVITDPLFMHEYGHTFDSQIFGPLYMFAIGIPSSSGASWTEKRANRFAAKYFDAHYGVDWSQYIWSYPLY